MSNRFRRVLLGCFIAGAVVLIVSCYLNFGTTDISRDPTYGNFMDVQGRWRTKTELYLITTDSVGGSLRLVTQSGVGHVVRVIPVGEVIQIEKLEKHASINVTLYEVTGIILAGKYAGKKMGLNPKLFTNDHIVNDLARPSSVGSRNWAVNPEVLERP